jgi:hypothetical protein
MGHQDADIGEGDVLAIRDLTERRDTGSSGGFSFGGSSGREQSIGHSHGQVSLVDAVSLVWAGFEQDVIVLRDAFGELGGAVTPTFRVAIDDTSVAADDGEFIAQSVVGGIRGDEWQVDLLGLGQ